MKKYNTSLKMLIKDEPYEMNEGFSRLKRVSFVASKAARCELDFPDEYRQILLTYLTGVRKSYGADKNTIGVTGAADSGLDYTKLKKKKDEERDKELAKKGAEPSILPAGLQNIMRYTETFFGAYATQTLSPENFQTVEKLFNMFVMDSVPYVYCQALNRLMRMFLPIIKIYLEEIEEKQKPTDTEAIKIKMPNVSLLYQEYCRKVVLPGIFRDAVSYTNKVKSYKISFLKKPEGRNMTYSLLFFKNFAKEFLLNDNFDVNKLKEDLLDFKDIFKLSFFKSGKPIDTVDAFEQFIEAVEFDNRIIQTETDSIKSQFSQFDDQNSDARKSAIQVRDELKRQYVTHLITIIEKIFYDPGFINNIPSECKVELDQFLNFLKTR